VLRREDIERSPGLREACRILFGEEAEQRLREYLGSEGGDPVWRDAPRTAEGFAQ